MDLLFDVLLIRSGSLTLKLQSFFGDVSDLKVCKLNLNYAIEFYKCSRKKLAECPSKNVFDI